MPLRFSADRAFARVDLAAIRRNFCTLRAHAQRTNPKARMIAVVKCNAYGHGLLRVSAALAAEGCDFFAVASPEEALTLRTQNQRADILVLGYTPPRLASLLAKMRITQTVFSAAYAAALSGALQERPLSIHIKLDGGLCREGFDLSDAAGIAFAASLKNLHPCGVYTHFPCADTDPAQTRRALQAFLRCRAVLGAHTKKLLTHAAASAALLSVSQSVLDAVRPGLALYGLSPCKTELPLTPALSLHAPIQQIRAVPKGTAIGYGGDFVTESPTRIGTLPIGYGDGLCRRMSGHCATLQRGTQRLSLPICGRISMDLCTVDLASAPVAVGDTVCLWKNAAVAAAHADTIPYEILTSLSARLERIYV